MRTHIWPGTDPETAAVGVRAGASLHEGCQQVIGWHLGIFCCFHGRQAGISASSALCLHGEGSLSAEWASPSSMLNTAVILRKISWHLPADKTVYTKKAGGRGTWRKREEGEREVEREIQTEGRGRERNKEKRGRVRKREVQATARCSCRVCPTVGDLWLVSEPEWS